MTEIGLRDYIVIGELPDGSVVFVRGSVMAHHWDDLHEAVEESVALSLTSKFPGVVPVKGRAGWSDPYPMPIGD